ncbi:MAG: RNA polymerase sigma factor, partial [Terriglobales bacterium]
VQSGDAGTRIASGTSFLATPKPSRIWLPFQSIGKIQVSQNTWHIASMVAGPTLFKWEAHLRRSRSSSDAPWWDTRGTGKQSHRRRTPGLSPGSYTRLVHRACVSFHQDGSKREIGIVALNKRCGYTPEHKFEDCLELFAFTREYVERLREGDPSTEQHFVAYFDQLLRIKLRARMLASETVEDLRQETYIRVFVRVRKGEVRQPERFGAFVNSICNHVLMEFYRTSSKTSPWDDSYLELPDKAVDTEGLMVTKQSKEAVRKLIKELPKRDRDLLTAYFLEEKEKEEVCERFGVDGDYFRVLLHRAKDKFRVLYEKERDGLSGKLPPNDNR